MAVRRNSMYALGGVMGVLSAPAASTPGVGGGSRLNVADLGVRGNSEGKTGERGVWEAALRCSGMGIVRVFLIVLVGGGEGMAVGRGVSIIMLTFACAVVVVVMVVGAAVSNGGLTSVRVLGEAICLLAVKRCWCWIIIFCNNGAFARGADCLLRTEAVLCVLGEPVSIQGEYECD